MVDHNDLRKMFAESEAPNTLDAARIITKSRNRRRPRQIAAGAIGALAIAGIGVLVTPSLIGVNTGVTLISQGSGAASDSDSSVPAPEAFAQKRAPADRINLCTAPLSEVAPSFYGLQLDAEFPASAPADGGPITGTVRLTNTSTERVTGYTAASPAMTLSQGGVVLWHSNGPMIMSAVLVDLAPGESLEYTASVTPVSCSVDDDLAEGFPEGLPSVPAGEYQLSALIDFNADASMTQQETPELDLVSGPVSTITLQ